jgi:biopolymer transport protein ExbD
MNFRKYGKREEPEINLIPLIDVFLVIIIFLMVTTTYSKFSELQITLPTADAEKASTTQRNEISVAVASDGKYAIDGQMSSARSAPALAEALRAATQKLKAGGTTKDPVIIINADAQATHQAVVNVMEAARLAQLSQITFATQSAPAGN